MVDSIKILQQYFTLGPSATERFVALGPLYQELNKTVNVVSRKDMNHLYLHHILHSLAISKTGLLQINNTILDLGTGGGFPGIPMAILHPECHFTLIDGTLKKINVVREISRELGLENLHAFHARAEEFSGTFDYILSRAVAKTKTILSWSLPLLSREKNSFKKNHGGILLLKGGDLTEELRPIKTSFVKYSIAEYFAESYFSEKYILFFASDNFKRQ